MRNIDLKEAYASIYKEQEQIDEALPVIAAAAGKLAGMGAAKAATAGAAKMGGGLAKAAGSKMGKAAISAGANKVQNSVQNRMEAKGGKDVTSAQLMDMDAHQGRRKGGSGQGDPVKPAKKKPITKLNQKGVIWEEDELQEKEGKKDACYHKVKSRYDVWPSAYASGALVKCRNKGAKNWGSSSKKEEVEAMFALLIGEGVAHDEESAIHILTHMSDEWYDNLVEDMIDEGMADQGVSGDEAMKRHGIKKHDGAMKVQKLKPRGMRKGEGLGVGARKRQGAGKVSAANPSDNNPKARVQ